MGKGGGGETIKEWLLYVGEGHVCSFLPPLLFSTGSLMRGMAPCSNPLTLSQTRPLAR